MSATWVATLAAGTAAALFLAHQPRLPPVMPAVVLVRADGWLMRHRLLWSALAGVGAWTFVGGSAGVVAALVAGAGAWVAIGRAEPPVVRRRREEVGHDLPHVVTLLAAALRAGAAPGEAVQLVARALPGAAADRLGSVSARLHLGDAPASVWADLGNDPELSPLGRTMSRAHRTGAPVVGSVERLADELAASARATVEDRARAVGVKAAVPLGLCLLPAFVLIGIVPLVVGLLTTIDW